MPNFYVIIHRKIDYTICLGVNINWNHRLAIALTALPEQGEIFFFKPHTAPVLTGELRKQNIRRKTIT